MIEKNSNNNIDDKNIDDNKNDYIIKQMLLQPLHIMFKCASQMSPMT